MSGDWTLKPHPSLPKGKPVLVCIFDGFGENKVLDEWNAVHMAKTPHFDKLREVPGRFRAIAAHGPAVGLPTWDDMGNSEVGHNALGAGKIYAQGAKLVDLNIGNGQIFTDPGWKYISSAFESNTVHFIGLLSDGGVHSRANQLSAMVQRAASDGAKKIRCHVLTDGRDVHDGTSIGFLEALEAELAELSSSGCDARIASGGGRMKVAPPPSSIPAEPLAPLQVCPTSPPPCPLQNKCPIIFVPVLVLSTSPSPASMNPSRRVCH
jgi:2,3-bisphosphoglycerate-independent phosphoglycerate mutase